MCYVAIKQYFPGIFNDNLCCGLASHFQMQKIFVIMIIMIAKTEFLQLREDARLKTDLTRKFWG